MCTGTAHAQTRAHADPCAHMQTHAYVETLHMQTRAHTQTCTHRHCTRASTAHADVHTRRHCTHTGTCSHAGTAHTQTVRVHSVVLLTRGEGLGQLAWSLCIRPSRPSLRPPSPVIQSLCGSQRPQPQPCLAPSEHCAAPSLSHCSHDPVQGPASPQAKLLSAVGAPAFMCQRAVWLLWPLPPCPRHRQA